MPKKLPNRAIKWTAVLDYLHYAASQGNLIIALLEDGVLPADYQGPGTRWPTLEEAYEHFVRHPENWELVERGYQWRSFHLLDLMQSTRMQVLEGNIQPQAGRVLIDSCDKEIKNIAAVVHKDKRSQMEARRKALIEIAERERRVQSDQKTLDKEREALRKESERAKDIYQRFEEKQREWLKSSKPTRKKVAEKIAKGEEKTIAQLMAEAEAEAEIMRDKSR